MTQLTRDDLWSLEEYAAKRSDFRAEERAVRLGEMIGIEDQVWLQVGDLDRIVPIADEDLDRTTADKTASVHFLRFEVTPEQINAQKDGAILYAGVDHPGYPIDRYEVPAAIRESLTADLVLTEH